LRVKARLCHNVLNAVWDPNTLAGPKLKKKPKRTKTKQKLKILGQGESDAGAAN
jgi:hypothetical protein